MNNRLFLVCAAVGLALLASPAVQAGGGCGCDVPAACNCSYGKPICHRSHCKTHCHHHYHHGSQQERVWSPPPPSGPIVDSMPAPRAMAMSPVIPMMVMPQMPMMSVRSVAYAEPEERSYRSERTCESSSGRIDQLEQRFDRLTQRVDVIQQGMERQTDILEAIKRKFDSMTPPTPAGQ